MQNLNYQLLGRVEILALIILNADVSFKVIKEKEEKKTACFHCNTLQWN